MPSFLAAVLVAAVVAFGAHQILDGYQMPAESAFATTGVRL